MKKGNEKSGVIGGCYLQKFKRERIGQLLQGVGGVHCLIEDGRQVIGVLDEDHHPCDTLVQTVRRHQSQVVLIFFGFCFFVCVLCFVCGQPKRKEVITNKKKKEAKKKTSTMQKKKNRMRIGK